MTAAAPQPAAPIAWEAAPSGAGPRLRFEPLVLDQHLALVHGWMQEPHVVPWWELDGPVDRTRTYLAGQLALPHLTPWVVRADGRPFAYVETYRAGEDPLAAHVAAAQVGVTLTAADRGWHVLIGPPDALGTGWGRALGRAVLDHLFAEAGVTRVVCEPHADNLRMQRFCAALGHRELARLTLPDKPAVLLGADAPPSPSEVVP